MNIIKNICLFGGPILLQFIKHLEYDDVMNICDMDEICKNKIINNKNLWSNLHLEKFGKASHCMELYYKKLSSTLYITDRGNNYYKISDKVRYVDGNMFSTYYINYNDVLFCNEDEECIEIARNIKKVVVSDEIYVLDNVCNLYVYQDYKFIKILENIKDIEYYFFDRIIITNNDDECLIFDNFKRYKKSGLDVFLIKDKMTNYGQLYKLIVIKDNKNYSNQIKKVYYNKRDKDSLLVILISNHDMIWVHNDTIDVIKNVKTFTSLGLSTYYCDNDNIIYQKLKFLYKVAIMNQNILKLEYSAIEGLYILCENGYLYKHKVFDFDYNTHFICENVIDFLFDEFKISSFLIKY